MILPNGTVTFLFTDIEGSTRLWEAHPDEMRLALARHDDLMRGAIERYNGYVFKTIGDAFCAAFFLPSDAIEAAIAVQISVVSEQWPHDINIRVRSAAHTGAVECRNNDYYGPDVNRVARLLSTGYGGQTIISGVLHDLCIDSLPQGCTLRPLGEHRLKDLGRPETVFQICYPGLPLDFPPLKSLDNPVSKHNLPLQLTSFVGREKQIAEILSLLKTNRLVTLTGTGGTGKTRLALQEAAEMLEAMDDGVWLVELAAVSEPNLVPQAVAEALNIREAAGDPITRTLIATLRDKRTLLVLDNCEHLLDSSASLVDELLKYCPNLKVLVSSREALGIAGEISYRVPPLSMPEPNDCQTLDTLSQYESIRLFSERAAAVNRDYMLTDLNAQVVASVCRRLDGIPLAIELSAARVRSLTVEQIAALLDDRFRVLTGGSRTALPRQQTLQAMIDWSYDLLDDKQKALLRRLCVFAGGWRLEGAEHVCAEDDGTGDRQSAVEGASGHRLPIADCLLPMEVLDLLTALVDKSLVVSEERGKAVRYRLLETIRQYSQDRLAGSGEGDLIRERHLQYFLGMVETARSNLFGPDQAQWLEVIEHEHENLRMALGWSLQSRRGNDGPDVSSQDSIPGFDRVSLRLCTAMFQFWITRGHLSEGRDWCARALSAAPDHERTSVLATVLNGAGLLAADQGDYTAARSSYEQSLAIQRENGNRKGIAASLNNIGNLAHSQGDYPAAKSLYREALSLNRELDNRAWEAMNLGNLANVALSQAEYVEARAYQEASLAIRREIGDKRDIALSLGNLGLVEIEEGNYVSASANLEESLAIRRAIGDRRGIAVALTNLGSVAHYQGNYDAAAAYLDESLAIQRDIVDRRGMAASLAGIGRVAASKGNYREARAHLEESLAIRRQIEDREAIAGSLASFASLAAMDEIPNQAAALWGAAEAIRDEIGSPIPPSEREMYNLQVAEERRKLGEELFASAWSKGRSMPLEEAIELALKPGSASDDMEGSSAPKKTWRAWR